MVIEMFDKAPPLNPDGTTGVHLNILVNDPVPHHPSCAQASEDSANNVPMWRADHFGSDAQRNDLRSPSIGTVRSQIFRYALSAHSSSDPSSSACPSPGGGPFPPFGNLPDYDWSPFGSANTGGRTIVISASIMWICPDRLTGCYENPPGFDIIFHPIYPNATAQTNGIEHKWPYPVADMLGFGNLCAHGNCAHLKAIENDGAAQLYGRVLAHLLGVSLGLSDAEAHNDPTAPALFANGALQIRPPDPYARWTSLTLAPDGVGKPHAIKDGDVPYYPDINRLKACDPSSLDQGREISGRVSTADDPCVNGTWSWQ
jgi:hypothetical protein